MAHAHGTPGARGRRRAAWGVAGLAGLGGLVALLLLLIQEGDPPGGAPAAPRGPEAPADEVRSELIAPQAADAGDAPSARPTQRRAQELPAGTLLVRVLDHEGRPLPDVDLYPSVWPEPAEGEAPADARSLGWEPSDAHGEARWDVPPAGAAPWVLGLTASPPDGWLAKEWEGPLPSAPLVLRVSAPGRLGGSVLERTTGAPLRMGRLRVEWTDPEGLRQEAEVEVRDGTWELVGQVVGRVELLWLDVAPGLAFAFEPADLVVEPGAEVLHDVLYDSAPTLEVEVLDAATGAPVEGAQVHDSLAGGTSFLPVAPRTTDEDGLVVLPGRLPPGRPLLLLVQHVEYAPAQERVEPGGAGVRRATVRLQPRSALRGRVVDAAGVPQGGAYVQAWSLARVRPNQQLGFAEARCDADGRFALEGVPTGLGFVLEAVVVEYGATTHRVEAGAEVDGRDWVVLPYAGLVGEIRSEDGPLPEGLKVSALSLDANGDTGAVRFARPNSAGRFELFPMPPGRWLVGVDLAETVRWYDGSRGLRRRVAQEVDLPPGTTARVELELPGDGEGALPGDVGEVRLWVQVADAATGARLSFHRGMKVHGVDSDFFHAELPGPLPPSGLPLEVPAGRHLVRVLGGTGPGGVEVVDVRAGGATVRVVCEGP